MKTEEIIGCRASAGRRGRQLRRYDHARSDALLALDDDPVARFQPLLTTSDAVAPMPG